VPPERSGRTYIIREIVELLALIAGLAIAARWFSIPLWVWIGLPLGKALLSAAFYGLFLRPALRRPPRLGHEALIGATARTITPLAPSGRVVIRGETWPAIGPEGATIGPEQEVTIVEIRCNTLLVDLSR
jgi:membrane protein implicated in regulation of membrane protease activity